MIDVALQCFGRRGSSILSGAVSAQRCLPRPLGNSKLAIECKSRGLGEVDHGVDGQSAGPTLKALCKVLSVGVCGLLPEMHEVTRRVMHRLVIS